jgi:hypothetical protein
VWNPRTLANGDGGGGELRGRETVGGGESRTGGGGMGDEMIGKENEATQRGCAQTRQAVRASVSSRMSDRRTDSQQAVQIHGEGGKHLM